MTVDDVINYYGSVYRLQKKTKIAYRTVARWRKNGVIPIQTQIRIEAYTQGQLKASLQDVK
jgi:hypothetical protein